MLLRVVGLALTVTAATLILVGRTRHPDWTETQLLLRMWPEIAICCFGAVVWIAATKLEDEL